jgi:hypothetical protein
LLLRRQSRHTDQLPPGPRVETLPGCGHLPVADDPGSVAELITRTAARVSVGIAEGGSCPDLPTLLAHADGVMYEAKRVGGGCWRLFEDTERAADPALA